MATENATGRSGRRLVRTMSLVVERAKGLPPPKQNVATAGPRDSYCVIMLNGEVVARTRASESREPVWLEEYRFNCASVNEVVIRLCDLAPRRVRSEGSGRPVRLLSGNDTDCVGIVRIDSSVAQAAKTRRRQWMPLLEPDESHARILLAVTRTPVADGSYSIRVTVRGLREGHSSKGASRHVTIRASLVNGPRKVKQTAGPLLVSPVGTIDGGTFLFEHQPVNADTLLVIKVAYKKRLGNRVVGLATVNIADIAPTDEHCCFYELLDTLAVAPHGLLSVRYECSEDVLLTIDDYRDLQELLFANNMEVLRALGKVCKEREEVVRASVRLFELRNCTAEALLSICEVDMKETGDSCRNTLFRGNTWATKTMAMLMLEQASDELRTIVGPLVERVYTSGSWDVSEGSVSERDLKEISQLFDSLCEHIFGSVNRIPRRIRQVLGAIRSGVAGRYGEEQALMAVSSFVFLRFFCPALVSPRQYGVHDENPPRDVAKVLSLLAKLLSNLSLGMPSTLRDPDLDPLCPLVEARRADMQAFLAAIATDADVAEAKEPYSDTEAAKVELGCLHRNMRAMRDELLGPAGGLSPETRVRLAQVLDDLESKAATVMKAA